MLPSLFSSLLPSLTRPVHCSRVCVSCLRHPPCACPFLQATAFRSFWGDKSELRRFQDGSIIEAAVWEVPTKLRPTIVHSIVQYILQRHLRVNPSAVTWQAASLEAVLEPGVACTLLMGGGVVLCCVVLCCVLPCVAARPWNSARLTRHPAVCERVCM